MVRGDRELVGIIYEQVVPRKTLSLEDSSKGQVVPRKGMQSLADSLKMCQFKTSETSGLMTQRKLFEIVHSQSTNFSKPAGG